MRMAGKISSDRGERGALLLEMALTLVIAAGISVFTAQVLHRYFETKRERATALYLESLVDAARLWAGTNSFQNTVQSSNYNRLASGGALLFDPFSVPLQTLKDDGYLPAQFPAEGPFGSAVRIRYVPVPVSSGSTALRDGQVLNIAVLLDYQQMGRARAMRILSHLDSAGIDGGYIPVGGALERSNGRSEAVGGTYSGHLALAGRHSLAAIGEVPLVAAQTLSNTDRYVFIVDRDPLNAALGTALEPAIAAWERRARDRLISHSIQQKAVLAGTALSRSSLIAGRSGMISVPTYEIEKHSCPADMAPHLSVFDRRGRIVGAIPDNYRDVGNIFTNEAILRDFTAGPMHYRDVSGPVFQIRLIAPAGYEPASYADGSLTQTVVDPDDGTSRTVTLKQLDMDTVQASVIPIQRSFAFSSPFARPYVNRNRPALIRIGSGIVPDTPLDQGLGSHHIQEDVFRGMGSFGMEPLPPLVSGGVRAWNLVGFWTQNSHRGEIRRHGFRLPESFFQSDKRSFLAVLPQTFDPITGDQLEGSAIPSDSALSYRSSCTAYRRRGLVRLGFLERLPAGPILMPLPSETCSFVTNSRRLTLVRKCVMTGQYMKKNPIRVKLSAPPAVPPSP